MFQNFIESDIDQMGGLQCVESNRLRRRKPTDVNEKTAPQVWQVSITRSCTDRIGRLRGDLPLSNLEKVGLGPVKPFFPLPSQAEGNDLTGPRPTFYKFDRRRSPRNRQALNKC